MNKRLPLSLVAFTASLVLFFSARIQAADAPAWHSLETDYGFMIGQWMCHATQAGAPDQELRVSYEWSYDRRILRENMRIGDKLIGEFFTTYDKATDRFKGVGVGAWGSYVVWENQGFRDGRLSEIGYAFDRGKMTMVSRSEFERISDAHYVVHDFEADIDSRKGKATDSEDCVKAK
jgi:hypothetical protein